MNEIEVTGYFLIYLLRILGKGMGKPNAGFGGLSTEIGFLICNVLGGQLIADRISADYSRLAVTMPIDNSSLPRSSSVYLITLDRLPLLLDWIIRHP